MFGVGRGCRSAEHRRIKMNDVEDKGNLLVILHILEKNSNVLRKFVITMGGEEENWIKVIQRFIYFHPEMRKMISSVLFTIKEYLVVSKYLFRELQLHCF